MSVSDQLDVAFRLRKAFPVLLMSDVNRVLELIPNSPQNPTADDVGEIYLMGERIRIPYRFYSEIRFGLDIENLPAKQRAIFSCIYTRHHSGFMRERFVQRLADTNEPWAVPYLFQLVGEYVVEIVQILLNRLDHMKIEQYVEFAEENPKFVDQTRRRVVSYWHLHYRREFPQFQNYPGFRFMDTLGIWRNDFTPYLLSDN